MAEGAQSRIWSYRSIYLLFGLSVIFYRLLPLETGTPGLPGPDFILCVTLVWVLRQPTAVPVGAILLLMLLSDFLLQRPPGLWTALTIAAAEYLRNRRAGIAETPFLFEWGMVAGVILAMVLSQRLILWVLLADQPSLGLSLMEGLATIVIYPVVVMVSKFALGMDKLPVVESEPGRP
ncbi:rod shape-determining protein MreD [Nioella aestuarii]|uniref:rod shape-determining protein MreD n=1 Tax=Nioella aestuarii TaxID=1662864 RepID=UPI003D7F95DD